jgi:hypothetical protein
LGFPGLGFFFALGVKGLGGVFSIRRRTSSREGSFAMSDTPTALHPSLLEGIGIIVQRWAYVEALEGEFLAYLVGASDNNLYVITQTVSGKSLTSWLRTLCDIKLTVPWIAQCLSSDSFST